MDAIIFIFQLLLKSGLLILPISVAWLAFRRLALSQSGNAWLYAATGMFATITAAGLAPWSIAGRDTIWLFFVLAPFCPAIWLGVVIVCSLDRQSMYETFDSGEPDQSPPLRWFDNVVKIRRSKGASTLVLENPSWPDAPNAVFRHFRNETCAEVSSEDSLVSRSNEPKLGLTVLDVARAMRGNESSDHRRTPKRLPPPEHFSPANVANSLPFLRSDPT